ncbi:hypothetical protein C8F04DRAFT_1391700 [Mycena alexandri]|uniref:Uncharacterized protein n=1 Tax=Mycena alexandri TaxID=1745969 RepID=A0AAD6T8T6_9AGAR|nr:hypothetical protein C8F04DRAFT_1391700 [Mycena alexandri]
MLTMNVRTRPRQGGHAGRQVLLLCHPRAATSPSPRRSALFPAPRIRRARPFIRLRPDYNYDCPAPRPAADHHALTDPFLLKEEEDLSCTPSLQYDDANDAPLFAASPSTPHTPATPARSTRSLYIDEWDSEDDEFVYGAAYDEDEDEDDTLDLVGDVEIAPEEELRLAVLPILTGAEGAHLPSGSISSPIPLPAAEEEEEPTAPALLSRWSSSALSSTPSIRSPHTHAAASPQTFSFARARRYFPRSKASTASTSTSPFLKENGGPMPRPMGTVAAFPSPSTSSPSGKKAQGGKKAKGGLTAAHVRRILPPSLLLPPSLSMSNALREHAYTDAAYSVKVQQTADEWVGTRPSAPSVLASAYASPDVFASYSDSFCILPVLLAPHSALPSVSSLYVIIFTVKIVVQIYTRGLEHDQTEVPTVDIVFAG